MLGLLALSLFTVLKLPEDRIKNYVEGSLSQLLAGRGMTFRVGSGQLSLGWGLSYIMKDVSITLPPTPGSVAPPPIRIETLGVSPSLSPLLFGKTSASFWIARGDSRIEGSGSLKSSEFNLTLRTKEADLGKLGLFPLLTQIQGGAVIQGEIDLSGDTQKPQSFQGRVQLDLKKIVIDSQTIQGFAVPKLGVSEGKIQLKMDQGKAKIETLRLGKPGAITGATDGEDDIKANLTGDVTVSTPLDRSQLNVKANFSLSSTVTQAFVLLDALIGAGKQTDGSYSYSLQGPIFGLMPTPIPASASP